MTVTGFKEATTDEGQIRAWWTKTPDANIGIATGAVSGIWVLDIDNKPAKGKYGDAQVLDLETRHDELPASFIQHTPSGGRHIVFSYDPEGKTITSRAEVIGNALDVRADGGYIIAAPSRGLNNDGDMASYCWSADDDPLEEGTREGLPPVAPEWLIELVGRDKRAQEVLNPGEIPISGLRMSELYAALAWISPRDRDERVRIGIHLKNSRIPSAYSVWSEWLSVAEDMFAPSKQLKNWNGFVVDKTQDEALASIFKIAMTNGWQNSKEAALRQAARAVHSGFVGGADTPSLGPPVLEPPPKELLRPPGVLGVFTDWCNDTAPKPQPAFAVQAALALGSIVAARYFVTDRNNYSSLYFVNVGPSACGKEHAKSTIEAALKSADLEPLIGPSGFHSASAIFSALQERPRLLTIVDELGKWIGEANSGGNSNRQGAVTQMIEIFGRIHGTLRPSGYSTALLKQQEKDSLNRVIERPALTVLGMTTPRTLTKALTAAQIEDGFIGRLLVMPTHNGRAPARTDFSTALCPSEVTQWARKLLDLRESQGNLATIEGPDDPVDPITVCFSNEAKKVYADFEQENIDKMNESDSSGLDVLFGRNTEKAMRLALIVSLGCDEFEISGDSMRWAVDYVRYTTEYVFDLASSGALVGERSETDEILSSLIDQIKRYGPEGAKFRDLCRTGVLRKFKPRDRDQYVEALIASEMVEVDFIAGKKRSVKVLRIIDDE